MAIGDISLSASARQNLLSLQSTSKLLGQTQARLGSGRKVNSSLDNASAFFSSKGFLNSANDLSALKDSMSTAIQTVKAATDAIESISDVIAQMQGLTNSALQTSDATTLAGLATQFNGLRSQIDGLVTDSVFNGTNLLDDATSGNTLQVFFNADNTTSLTVSGVNVTATGLGIEAAGGSGWGTSESIRTSQSMLQTALATLRTNASTFGSNNTILSTRQEFTNTLISTLQTASDNLVLADTNEEGANLQSLQAASSLGIIALGISGSQAQSILRLF
ncbi:MAG: flagellin [Proteobacteria bacterium]|jgi:flagellin-like hook-associated protein FlgL|nr:flagellin [Alphaproteobacteria bacterium]NCC04090.1 flagellin [Pseudomonadota bacterium]